MQYNVDMKPVKLGHCCGNQISIKQTFIDKCTAVLLSNTDNEISGKIRIREGGQLSCDFLVIAVLKTLIRMGVTPHEELAVACRRLFIDILHADPSYVTVGKMLGCLSKDTYELSQLSQAIREVANDK